jgi:short-subunit dehydrogenase
MVGFFDSLRVELRGTGVSVTVVAPDFVVTEIHRRAIGADGRPLGVSPLVEGAVMTADECSARIVPAIVRRERLVVFTLRARLGRWVKLVAPGLVDLIAARAISRRR